MNYLILTQGQVAAVSPIDFERVSAFKWYASAQGRTGDRFYAVRWKRENGKKVKVWLHRFIMGLPDSLSGPDPLVVDHADGDGLNCTRENLSVVPWSQNLRFVNGRLERKRQREEPCL